ncbi:efflux RND transporter periplasmic adaptor subunit [Singulisphaera rosea]
MSKFRFFVSARWAVALALFGVNVFGQGPDGVDRKITVSTVETKPVTLMKSYLCWLNAHHHIEVRAPGDGYLQEVLVEEGQSVKKGDRLFGSRAIQAESRLDSASEAVKLAEMELINIKQLIEKNPIHQGELLRAEIELAKVKAKANRARVESDLTEVRAPFDGMVDRLAHQQGSLVLKGETFTRLFDNKTMCAYFNVPEIDYLEFMAESDQSKDRLQIELRLANQRKFPHSGRIGAIDAQFVPRNGGITFRADFPNPEGLLRHGQSGTVIIPRVLKAAVVVPQRATFEQASQRYVFLVDNDRIVHLREISVMQELDDVFVVSRGLSAGDKIVLDGLRLARDGEKLP